MIVGSDTTGTYSLNIAKYFTNEKNEAREFVHDSVPTDRRGDPVPPSFCSPLTALPAGSSLRSEGTSPSFSLAAASDSALVHSCLLESWSCAS